MPIEPRSVMQSFFYNIIIPSIYFHPQRWPQLRRHQSESSSPPQSLQILRWFSFNKIFSSFLSKFKEPLQQQSNLVAQLWSSLLWLFSPFLSSSSNATVSFVFEDPDYVYFNQRKFFHWKIIYLWSSSKEFSSPCWSPSPFPLCWRFLIGSIC